MTTAPKTLLVISQTFVPDPASVGQHMADVAVEMARRGHRVKVYTSNRGYEDPTVRYAPRENLHGVEIRRLPLSSFGKKSILTRVIGTASFMAQVFFTALLTPRLGGIFFSTSPPLVGVVACTVGLLRRVPVAYWAMDLNPDQLIALGKITPTSFTARFLEAVNRFILRRSSLVVALDRFMADRLRARGVPDAKMLVQPPWPHDQHIEDVDRSTNPFRQRHGLTDDTFVVMYSGNHSPSNPLKTLLEAAVRLKDDRSIQFFFVGGGLGKKEVEAYARDHALANVKSLPYQPMSELRYSLSAADVHVVSLGEGMVGIIHPCKVYGAMTVGRPILFFGPRPSHVSDLLDAHAIGTHVAHGDVDAAIDAIRRLRETPADQRREMGRTAQQVLRATLAQSLLCGKLCDAMERSLRLEPTAPQPNPGQRSDNENADRADARRLRLGV
jgi:glycosyltransferase involved in cell wall biosynthesis